VTDLNIRQLGELKHLGDGAYVGHSDGELVIVAYNGIEITQIVYLEPSAVDALVQYIAELKGSN